jgi:hypothetical protein
VAPRPPGTVAQAAALLERFPPGVAALARGCLPRLRRALPGADLLVYDYPRSVVVSFSLTGRGYEGVFALAVDPARVRLCLPLDLPDPKGRLEGTGSKVRGVVLASAAELDRGDVHDLLRAAVRRAGAPSPPARPARGRKTGRTRRA